jgi:hypothetical protein
MHLSKYLGDLPVDRTGKFAASKAGTKTRNREISGYLIFRLLSAASADF